MIATDETADVKRIAELEADVAQRDLRILFLEGQCRLLAARIDELETEKRNDNFLRGNPEEARA